MDPNKQVGVKLGITFVSEMAEQLFVLFWVDQYLIFLHTINMLLGKHLWMSG